MRPGIYEAACNQKTPRKNSLKESNISMKKYHHRPTLGVRSGRSRRTAYVAAKKSQEPVMVAEATSRAPIAVAKPTQWTAIKGQTLGVDLVFADRAS